MSNTKALPDVINFPCQFCCKYMKVDKTTFTNGGLCKCKACGMVTRFQPHKNAGRKEDDTGNRKGRNPDGTI